MLVSKTHICNMALGHVGVIGLIEDVETEDSAEAIVCRLYFDQCRDLMLKLRPWPFVERTVLLQQIPEPTIGVGTQDIGWGYRYAYPADAARINSVRYAGQGFYSLGSVLRPRFRIIDNDGGYGRAILCDIPNALVTMNYAETDVSKYDATMAQALTLCLAAHIAKPLRVDQKIASAAMSEWVAWSNEAAIQASNEMADEREADSDFSSFISGRA